MSSAAAVSMPDSQASPLTLVAEGLDRLLAEDPLELTADVLGARIRELLTARNRLDAAYSRHLQAFDHTRAHAALGAGSTAAWLRSTTQVSPALASEQVRVARQLTALPEVGEAFAAGDIGFQHCQVVTRVVEGAPAEVASEAEPALLDAARNADPHRLAGVTRHLLHTFDPEASAQEATRNRARCRLHISESLDGLFFLDGILDSEGGAALHTVLDAIMGPPAPDDTRTASERRAAALSDLARYRLDVGDLPIRGGQRPHLTLTADLATLARLPGSRAADLDWGQPVPAETARRLACDVVVTPVLMDADGSPLSAGRARRLVRGPLRRAVIARDRHCVLCGRPATWTDVHHIRHWVDGGKTCIDNICLICRRCHTLVHEGGWVLARTEDGRFVALPP